AKRMIVVRFNIDTIDRAVPQWLEVDAGEHKATVRDLPLREQIDVPVREQLIVELYSKQPTSPSSRGLFMLIIQRPDTAAGARERHLQRCTIAPPEPGFGPPLGNSRRRTLLSSIPGASVTQVRFDDALHEFDVIKGVKEDVTDIILNLKDLVLRCSSEEPVTLRLDKRGPAGGRAADIQTTADVEILNGDLYIANVNAAGRIALDLTVEQGRGYLSAERNKRTTTIGVIPVDAIFSPVRRVSFSVEPTRVEQATNFDKLTLEIETDGS